MPRESKEPKFKEGQEVFTPAGVGKIKRAVPQWDSDDKCEINYQIAIGNDKEPVWFFESGLTTVEEAKAEEEAKKVQAERAAVLPQ